MVAGVRFVFMSRNKGWPEVTPFMCLYASRSLTGVAVILFADCIVLESCVVCFNEHEDSRLMHKYTECVDSLVERRTHDRMVAFRYLARVAEECSFAGLNFCADSYSASVLFPCYRSGT